MAARPSSGGPKPSLAAKPSRAHRSLSRDRTPPRSLTPLRDRCPASPTLLPRSKALAGPCAPNRRPGPHIAVSQAADAWEEKLEELRRAEAEAALYARELAEANAVVTTLREEAAVLLRDVVAQVRVHG